MVRAFFRAMSFVIFVSSNLIAFNGCRTLDQNNADAEIKAKAGKGTDDTKIGFNVFDNDRLPGATVVSCIDGTRGYKIQKENDKLVGYFKDFSVHFSVKNETPTLKKYSCKSMKSGPKYRCYGVFSDGNGSEMDLEKNAYGQPVVRFYVVNKPDDHEDADTFILTCDSSSAKGF